MYMSMLTTYSQQPKCGSNPWSDNELTGKQTVAQVSNAQKEIKFRSMLLDVLQSTMEP